MEHYVERHAIPIALAILYLVNFHCWTPGLGGRTDRDTNGVRPQGNECEIYLGYPACYMAELWRSDSPDRTPSIFASSPFIPNPIGYTTPYRYFSMVAVVLDLGFAVATLWLTYAIATTRILHWKNWHTALVFASLTMIVIAYYFSWDASAHL